MAQINLESLKKVEKTRNNIHDEVFTTYTVFMHEGEKYVQFDMYGRVDRENPEKISQTVQINRDAAKYIVNLLSQEFNLK